MKKSVLKFKIIITNISRVIMSFLFVNLSSLFPNSYASQSHMEITCYAPLPPDERSYFASINLAKVFIIAVPIVLVIALVSFIIIEMKKNKEKDNKGE